MPIMSKAYIQELTDTVHTFSIINLIITVVIIITSIAIPIKKIFFENNNFPKKVFTICPDCNMQYNTFLIRNKKTPSNVKTIINTNIAILSLITIINIFFDTLNTALASR